MVFHASVRYYVQLCASADLQCISEKVPRTHARAQMPLIVVAKLLAARMCCKEWRFVLHRSAPGAMPHNAQLQIAAKRGQKMRFE